MPETIEAPVVLELPDFDAAVPCQATLGARGEYGPCPNEAGWRLVYWCDCCVKQGTKGEKLLCDRCKGLFRSGHTNCYGCGTIPSSQIERLYKV